jgi:Integrase core domain/Mu transposase, C-terminal
MTGICTQPQILMLREKTREVTWIPESILFERLDITDGFIRKSRSMYKDSVPLKSQNDDTLPDTGNAWRFKKRNGVFYYDYDRIPDRNPQKYRSKLGDLTELMSKGTLEGKKVKQTTTIEALNQRVKLFRDDFYQHYAEKYNDSTSEGLALGAAWLEAIYDLANAEGVNLKHQAFFVEVAKIVEHERVPYLPHNPRRLKDKILLLSNKAGHTMMRASDVVVLPREGNNNARKYDDMEILAWVLLMRSSGNNYTDRMIIRRIALMCDMTGKKTPSEAWFTKIFAEHETKILTTGRWGERGRNAQVYKHYTPIENALYAGDCWQMDGTRANLISYKDETGKQRFPYVVVVRDVHSGAILGLSIGLAESAWMYINALRMAVQNTGYLPYEIVTDRFSGHNKKDWIELTDRVKTSGIKITYTHEATGKAKLERFFSTLQSVFMALSNYYYGEGIQGHRPFSHRSSEALNKMKKAAKEVGWSFDKACDEIENIIGSYNSTPLSKYSDKFKKINESPLQLHEESPKENVKIISAWETLKCFGYHKSIDIRHSYIETTIHSIDYIYAPPVDVVLKYPKVMIAYDLNDLRKIYLFTEDGRKFLGEAPEQKLAQKYGPNVDYSILGKSKERGRLLKEAINAKYQEIVGHTTYSEVDLLMNGLNSKAEIEQAETAFLLGEGEPDTTILGTEPRTDGMQEVPKKPSKNPPKKAGTSNSSQFDQL